MVLGESASAVSQPASQPACRFFHSFFYCPQIQQILQLFFGGGPTDSNVDDDDDADGPDQDEK